MFGVAATCENVQILGIVLQGIVTAVDIKGLLDLKLLLGVHIF